MSEQELAEQTEMIAAIQRNSAFMDDMVRKQQEMVSALRRSQKRLALAQQIAHMGCWEYNLVAQKMAWSPELFRILEFDPDAEAPSFEQLTARFHPDDAPLHTAAWNKATKEGVPFAIDIRARSPEGRQGWVHVIGRAERDETGGIVGLFGAIMDINERKWADQEQAVLTTVLDRTSDLVATATLEGRVLYCNQALCDFLGISTAEVFALTLKDFYTPTSWERVQADILPTALRVGEWNGESVYVSGEGRAIPVALKLFVHTDVVGKVQYLSAVARDVSQTEASLRQAQTRLRDLQRTAQIANQEQEMTSEIRQRDSAGGQVEEIAFDFNNLMSVMRGYAELVAESIPKTNGLKSGNVVTRTANLTCQLRRHKPINPTVLETNAVVEEIITKLQPLFGRSIELITDYSPNVCHIYIDYHQLEQIIVNLVTNAVEAMPNGGSLTVKTTDVVRTESIPRQEAPLVPAGRFAVISINDTGMGMTSEVYDRLFEPFFTTKENGAGLGLATVYSIVKQNRGFVWAFTDPGVETRFRVWLPCHEDAHNDPATS